MNEKKKLIIDTLNQRYACKKYNPHKKVSDDDFNTILEAGRLAPSSFGFEPWKFLVIKNKNILEKLRPVAWGALASLDGASHFVIILARKGTDTIYSSDYIKDCMLNVQKLPLEVAIKKGERFENFQKENFDLEKDNNSLFEWACRQTYMAMSNMINASAYLGIDSCPIEGFNRAEVDELLYEEGILDKEHFGVSVMVSFGYRDEDIKNKTRRTIDEVVEWIE